MVSKFHRILMVNLKYKFVFKFFFLRLDKHADQDMFKFSFQID